MTHDTCKHRWQFTDTGKAVRYERIGIYMLHCSRCYEARLAQLTGGGQ